MFEGNLLRTFAIQTLIQKVYYFCYLFFRWCSFCRFSNEQCFCSICL